MTSPIGITSSATDTMVKNLFEFAIGGQWVEVVAIYRDNPAAYKARITKSGDTALHVAVNDGEEYTVQELVAIISRRPNEVKLEGLKVANKKGNTPLHLAASMGNVQMCSCIARQDPSLVGVRNNDNETPFFLAALHGKKDAFFCLYNYICGKDKSRSYYRRKDGETILHVAISGEYFDLSFQIIHLYSELVHYVDHRGISPLHLLASKPNAFRSGSPLGGYKKIIYNCTFVEELKAEEVSISNVLQDQTLNIQASQDVDWYPKNYQTCSNFIGLLKNAVRMVTMLFKDRKHKTGDSENQQGNQSATGARGHRLLPSNYHTCFELFKLMSKAMLVILGLGSSEITKLAEKKKKHKWSVQIMNELLQQTSVYEYEHGGSCPLPSEDDYTQPYAFGVGGSVIYSNHMELQENRLQMTRDDRTKQKNQSTGEDSKDKDGKGLKDRTSETGKMKIQILTSEKNGVTETLEKILSFFPVENKNLDKNNIVLMATKKPKAPLMEKIETPILIAAKNGVVEMVQKILEKFPVAIHDVNAEKKNIVLLAVENRQPHVYKFLLSLERSIMKESIFREVDNDGISALHLAATLGDFKPWRIPGAAL